MTIPLERIETDAYWLTFTAAFLAVAFWESRHPQRNLSTGVSVSRRWSHHGVLLFASSILSIALQRASPVIVAIAMMNSRFGLLNKPWLPYPVRFVLTIVLLDLARYAVHWSFHAVPLLWRAHQVHHSDPDFDLSTGGRNHPIEAILALAPIVVAVGILAPPPAAMLALALLGLAQSFFSHANASLPEWLEKPLRWIIITPDMHRVHHSEEVQEQSLNLGEIFPWWDHLFRTYLEAPAAGQEKMKFGLKGFQNDESLGLAFMFMQPFRNPPQEVTPQETPVATLH